MQNLIIRNSVYVLVVISAIVWFSLAWIKGLTLSEANDFFSLIPQVASIDLAVIAVFVKWGWKYSLFRGWLVTFPNLTGTWMGLIYSEWINPETGEKPQPIPAMMTINQSFFNISCVMRTEEMTSNSFMEGFIIDAERQIKQLVYSYTARPAVSINKRSIPNDGTGIFQIVEKPTRQLQGRYWTEQMTRGEIVLNFYGEGILERMPDSLESHPVTEIKNRRQR